jgi:hypothetical protein
MSCYNLSSERTLFRALSAIVRLGRDGARREAVAFSPSAFLLG